MIVVTLALIAVASCADINPDIVYKYTDAFQLIWNDGGSGGDLDVSIWSAKNYQSEYCSLGDVAVSNYAMPKTKAVLVSAKKQGALVHPTSFTKVWDDAGSGADMDGSVYRMNAPSGYTCLGGVAVRHHSTQPDSNKYCCVKNDYVVQADTVQAYHDGGTGSDKDLSVWTVIRAGGDAYGIDGGNFVGVSGYSRPDAAWLLKEDSAKVRDVWSLPTGGDKPLNLYEVSELKKIWDDAGSGASADVSIWRAESREGYYPVGDIVVATHSKPRIGFLVRPTSTTDDSSIRAPVSYSEIWNDAGSGADKDVKLWRVNCPGGYVALGGVATDGSYPKLGDIYCVNSKYTTQGSSSNWGYTWRDHGSGASRDVSIYEARAKANNQQSVRGFGSVASYNYYPNSPRFLNKQFHTYWAEKPIEKIYMYNVKYDLDAERQQTAPVQMSPTVINNFSNISQKATRSISYSLAESSSFTFSQAIQLGISVEITAGSPLIGAAQKTTVSVVSTSTFTSGTTTTKTHTDTINAWIELPGHSKITAVITGTEYKADIPYTATIKKVYYDGTQAYATISGVYKGVAVSEIGVTYSEIEPFDAQL